MKKCVISHWDILLLLIIMINEQESNNFFAFELAFCKIAKLILDELDYVLEQTLALCQNHVWETVLAQNQKCSYMNKINFASVKMGLGWTIAHPNTLYCFFFFFLAGVSSSVANSIQRIEAQHES